MISTGGKCWFTAAELADLALPGLPRQKRKINERAADEFWAVKTDASGAPLARTRQGRGGGAEYHLSLLPAAAKAELVKRGVARTPANDEDAVAVVAQAHGWAWYEAQTDKVKGEAMRRAAAIGMIEALEEAGMTRTAAIRAVSVDKKVSTQTLWNWLALVSGVAAIDRLPVLAPRRKGGGKEADVDAGAFQFYKSDYLRPERPTFASCYDRTLIDYAVPRGITLPTPKTMQRKFEREVDPRVVVLMRKGADAMKSMVPAQERDKSHLHAMQAVNIDGHVFDVFVNFGPDANGRDVIERPTLVGIQDVYSGKLLAWRVGDTESALLTRLAFADLFRKWGVPRSCTLDNGRAFASKWITGGALSRFRFKIRDDEPLGLLPSLGVTIRWATPYHGQAKPIERAWRDVADRLARDPRCAGAYTGNRIDAKPENYRSRAVPLQDFLGIVDHVLHAHNARPSRRSAVARGRSLDETFAESYARASIGIGKATEEHLRLALLTGEQVRADRNSGKVKIGGNLYWTPTLSGHAGQLLTIRFDPDDLSLPVHVYDLAGTYLCSAAIWEKAGYDDMAAAKRQGKLRGDIRKTVRRLRDQENLLSAEQLAAQMRSIAEVPAAPEPAVLSPARHRGQTAAALRTISEGAQAPLNDQFMGQMSSAIGRLRLVE